MNAEEELLEFGKKWDEAIVSNNVDEIANSCLTIGLLLALRAE
jgi:hypothetical protein